MNKQVVLVTNSIHSTMNKVINSNEWDCKLVHSDDVILLENTDKQSISFKEYISGYFKPDLFIIDVSTGQDIYLDFITKYHPNIPVICNSISNNFKQYDKLDNIYTLYDSLYYHTPVNEQINKFVFSLKNLYYFSVVYPYIRDSRRNSDFYLAQLFSFLVQYNHHNNGYKDIQLFNVVTRYDDFVSFNILINNSIITCYFIFDAPSFKVVQIGNTTLTSLVNDEDNSQYIKSSSSRTDIPMYLIMNGDMIQFNLSQAIYDQVKYLLDNRCYYSSFSNVGRLLNDFNNQKIMYPTDFPF